MILYIGADHRGFQLKESVKEFLKESGYTVEDVSADSYDENDDYVDFAKYVGQKVDVDATSKGILICGSGVGMDASVNKFINIRGALAFSSEQAMASRTDDDANVLILASDFTDEEAAKRIISVWLQSSFSGEERYKRRIEKLRDLGSSIH